MEAKLKKNKILVAIVCLLITLGACQNSTNNNNDNSLNNKDTILKNKKRTQVVFYSLPSPLEMATIIQRTGVKYNEEILNNVDKAPNYVTNKSMALNLGVYGADLSYASLFEQKQTTIKYMNTVKKLGDRLGILHAIKESEMKRLEDNINNKDVILDVISETFFSTDAYLKENDRSHVAVLIVLGGWVESLYIALQLSEKSVSLNKELVERIVDLGISLESLINMMESYRENEDIVAMLKSMTELQSIYNQMIMEQKIETINPETKEKTIETQVKTNVTVELFNSLYDTVTKLRNNIISK